MPFKLRSYDKLRHYEYALQETKRQYKNNTLYNDAALEDAENPIVILDSMIECNRKLHTFLAFINKNKALLNIPKNTVCDFDYEWVGENITEELDIISQYVLSYVEKNSNVDVKVTNYHWSKYKSLKYLSCLLYMAAFVPIFVFPTSYFFIPLALIAVLTAAAYIINQKARNHYDIIHESKPTDQEINKAFSIIHSKENTFFSKSFSTENTLAKKVQDEYDNFLDKNLVYLS